MCLKNALSHAGTDERHGAQGVWAAHIGNAALRNLPQFIP
jgi:hypothetical protein